VTEGDGRRGAGARETVGGAGAPRVSVLMPVRNAQATLEEALASILAQTLDDLEVVALDDGSTDRSPEILETAAERDPRVRVLTRPPLGLVPALERARQAARAPLLARMDADDRAESDRLEAQAALLDADANLVLVGTHVRYFPRESLGDGALRYERWLDSLESPGDLDRDLWVECPLAHPTFLMRAGAVEAGGGYRDRGWPEDYDLLLRLRMAGGGLGVVPRVLHHWREGPDRLSRTDPRYSLDAFRRLKSRFLARSPLLRERDGVLIWGAGPVGKSFARALIEEGVKIRAFVDLDPRKVGQEIHGAPVVPPEGIERFRDALGLAAVGKEGARSEIRASFAAAGWVEGRDFVAVA
jgi:glycosyltransferase involved in cell wall biosynthesis